MVLIMYQLRSYNISTNFLMMPESIMEGRIAQKERIEYHFKTFGAMAVLFVEFKAKLSTCDECLNVVAQVIAECNSLLYISQIISPAYFYFSSSL
jgi:hypothetical protein